MSRSKFERRHYEAIAEVLNRRWRKHKNEEQVLLAVANDLCDMFAGDNGWFSADKWYDAVFKNEA